MSEAAIFRNVQQALHVSFLIMSEPAREKAAFRQTLIKIIESIGTLNRRQAAFLDYLYGEKSGTVNFEGLSPLEVRAQAALAVAAVHHHLFQAEEAAIHVHFAKGEMKRAGVLWLSNHLRPSLNLENIDAVQYLIAEQSLPKAARDPEVTLKFITERTGVPDRTLKRASQTIRHKLRALENNAYDTLTPLFERDGLIERHDQCS